jgi:sulfate permease
VVNELGFSDGGTIIMLLCVMLIAPWFGIGSSLMGRGVTKTIGREIVSIGVLGATFISVITASLLLIASTTRGIPTSLVQMNTFAVIALAMLKEGPGSVLSRLSILKLFAVWIVAPLIALGLAYLLTVLALSFGLLS